MVFNQRLHPAAAAILRQLARRLGHAGQHTFKIARGVLPLRAAESAHIVAHARQPQLGGDIDFVLQAVDLGPLRLALAAQIGQHRIIAQFNSRIARLLFHLRDGLRIDFSRRWIIKAEGEGHQFHALRPLRRSPVNGLRQRHAALFNLPIQAIRADSQFHVLRLPVVFRPYYKRVFSFLSINTACSIDKQRESC